MWRSDKYGNKFCPQYPLKCTADMFRAKKPMWTLLTLNYTTHNMNNFFKIRTVEFTFSKRSIFHIPVLVFTALELSGVDLLQLADIRPILLFIVTCQLCDHCLGDASVQRSTLLGAAGEWVPDSSLPGQHWGGFAIFQLDWGTLVLTGLLWSPLVELLWFLFYFCLFFRFLIWTERRGPIKIGYSASR